MNVLDENIPDSQQHLLRRWLLHSTVPTSKSRVSEGRQIELVTTRIDESLSFEGGVLQQGEGYTTVENSD